MNPRVLLVSAIASGQGKTTLTAALARKLRGQGQRVRVFKAGPDFIDPMMLERASGAPVETLDLWMTGLDDCRVRLARAAADADVILVEGVMGLYDGIPSSADLARALDIPVVLLLDAAAMAQTAGALVLGLRDYGPVRVAGVIANRVGGAAHAEMIADALPGVPLLATLPPLSVSLPERHLGLVQPSEITGVDDLFKRYAAHLELDARAWATVPGWPVPALPVNVVPERLHGKTVAIARDAAFAFLYPANLDCLRRMGAQLAFFSPLADEPVPPQADALWLPGGYPELHGGKLAAAQRWTDSVRAAHARGMPILAECGGMMALAEALTDTGGVRVLMAGLLPGEVRMHERLVAIGPQAWHTGAGELRGHAFHYSRLATSLAAVAHTLRHPNGTAGEPIYRVGSLLASYFHAYFPSCAEAVAAILQGSQP